jgi:hypothetical protein
MYSKAVSKVLETAPSAFAGESISVPATFPPAFAVPKLVLSPPAR